MLTFLNHILIYLMIYHVQYHTFLLYPLSYYIYRLLFTIHTPLDQLGAALLGAISLSRRINSEVPGKFEIYICDFIVHGIYAYNDIAKVARGIWSHVFF